MKWAPPRTILFRYHSHPPSRGVTLVADQARLHVLAAMAADVSAAVLVVEAVALHVITQPTQARASIGVPIITPQRTPVALVAEVEK